MKSKVLIVDDSAEIRDILHILLESEGYEVNEASDGIEAIEKTEQDTDLIILDIMMPKLNGYKACIEIRKKTNAPILFLTAKNQDSDKTLGFSSGGDDYMVKPFSYAELTSRVRALIRRYKVYQGQKTVENNSENKIIRIHNLSIDPNYEKVFKDDKHLQLTDIEYEILYLLANHRGQTFSAQHLFEKIWQEDYYYSANNTIMVHIRNLRKKIEVDSQNPKILKTVWGKGYRCE
jgi:DNA-binding response OmpR family regulator